MTAEDDSDARAIEVLGKIRDLVFSVYPFPPGAHIDATRAFVLGSIAGMAGGAIGSYTPYGTRRARKDPDSDRRG